MVYNTDGTTNPLNTTTPDGKPMDPRDGLREVWKGVDAPDGVELDYYLDNKGEVGDAVTYDILSVDSDIAPMTYVRQPSSNFTSYTSGKTTGGADLGSNLGPGDTESQVITAYTAMLSDADFYPRGLKQPKVSFSGDDLVISIEGKDYKIKDVWSNDNVADITAEIQGFVEQAVDSHSGGLGGAGSFND